MHLKKSKISYHYEKKRKHYVAKLIIKPELTKGVIVNKKTPKEFTSTYERLIHVDPNFEEDLNKEYQELILSELILALIQEDQVTVRKLAQEAGVSPSLIQDLKKGKKTNVTLKSFSNIMHALGYEILLKKQRGNPRHLLKLKLQSANNSAIAKSNN